MTGIFSYPLNTLRPRQSGRHFADYIFKCIFLNENGRISIAISLKFVPKGPINNIPALDQIMAWRRPGDKPLYEPMIVSFLTHICATRPQWVNISDNHTCMCLPLACQALTCKQITWNISCKISEHETVMKHYTSNFRKYHFRIMFANEVPLLPYSINRKLITNNTPIHWFSIITTMHHSLQ